MKSVERRILRKDDPAGIAVWVKHSGKGKLVSQWNGFAWVQLDGRPTPATFPTSEVVVEEALAFAVDSYFS